MNTNKTFLHTDLVLELQEELEGEGKKVRTENTGVSVQKRKRRGGKLQEAVVTIENEKGERLLGKPKGTYITLEGVDLSENDGAYHREMSSLLAEHLEKLLGRHKRILFAGLGNMDVTPDALGPLVIQNLLITNHLGELSFFKKMRSSMAIAPGVMAQTGMETGEILKGVIEKAKPDVLVAVDALAAKTSERLNRTIQLCSTGIAPGAGVKNKRKELSEETMGIPVIAVGVPTVISVPAIAGDIMMSFLQSLGDDSLLSTYESWTEREKYQFMAKSIPKELFELFVTPKEIDESLRRISYTISEGINQIIARKEGEKGRNILEGQAYI